LVTLQRVPPEMRILAPILARESNSRMRAAGDCFLAMIAARNPAAPAPTTATSKDTADEGLFMKN